MGTASRLACKSCWALLHFTSAKHAKQPGRAQMRHRWSCLLTFPKVMAGWARKEAACCRARRVSYKVAGFPYTVELYNLNCITWALLADISTLQEKVFKKTFQWLFNKLLLGKGFQVGWHNRYCSPCKDCPWRWSFLSLDKLKYHSCHRYYFPANLIQNQQQFGGVLKQAWFCCIGGALYSKGSSSSAWQTMCYEEIPTLKEVSWVGMASA